MNTQIDPKRLTDSRFGAKGWSIIIYTALLYYFWAGLCVDALNVYPDAFAAKMLPNGTAEELTALSNQLLGYATPAGIIGVLGGIIAGRLVLKTGVKKLTGICLIITGALYIVFGFVQTPAMFFLLLTLFTVVSTEFGLIATAGLMGNWFPRKKGVALGWATMGAPLCTATFVALIQKMYGSIGIPTSSAIVGVVLGVLAWLGGNLIDSNYLNILYMPGTGEIAIFMSAFVGALIGFLWYNSYPAQVFMGDTGSLTIGGIIGVSAVLIRKELLIPLLCGIFFVESLSVMLQRAYFKRTKKKYGEGRRIWSMTPLHHHYQDKKAPDGPVIFPKPVPPQHEAKITVRFWIVGIILAVSKLALLKIR